MKKYFALHEAGLKNGSFFRVRKNGVAQYINGDLMEILPEMPASYAGLPLVEFPQERAEKLIPKCCL